MVPAAEATLEHQDPDSLEEPEQEPEDVEAVEPVEDDPDAADPDRVAAEDDADSVGQPEDEGAAVEGQPRDEHGRFISPQAAAPSGQPAAESSPPAATPSGTPGSAQGTPFSFRVDGLAVEAEGAYEHDGRITMPREVWDRVVQPRVADRGRTQQIQERQNTRIRKLESEAEAREERFKTVLARVDDLLGDPNKLRAFADQYATQAPLLKTQIELELERSKAKRHEESTKTSQAEAEEREFRELMTPGLTQAVDVVIGRIAPDAKGVDKGALVTELQGLWDANVPIFFRVQEGDGTGLYEQGHKWGVNLDLVSRFAQPYVKLHQRTASEQAAAAVEAANKAATGRAPKAKAPPVAPAAGSPAPGGGEKYPTTREEYDKWKEDKGWA